ncbi:MAG TPA: PQQ-dependent sugar dehydrogenase [Lamprocystis sp. (in: g-proteobacteria)]|nr:PQQ-dependent sugar dehydrogenase [Lamprocystis sp. (in: g-proteobacteria)]
MSEREGRQRRLCDGKLDPVPIVGLPPVLAVGQGGLLDVSRHPDFAANGLVYLTFSTGSPTPPARPWPAGGGTVRPCGKRRSSSGTPTPNPAASILARGCSGCRVRLPRDRGTEYVNLDVRQY